ncbi:hypothetical protein [Petroclostridium sp. X23]|uniref:hypothetical protein n=1 Tax=Petroclostridium sp. X23 TaxID=3045146 RepID=UPI0024AE081C|nr:hypothetical protein [Petroclostridium sp. X23]WHH57757.1 hypothetical protein QKW49_18305 [Petroclostridium sp. X23]
MEKFCCDKIYESYEELLQDKEGKLYLYTEKKEEEIYVPPCSRYQLEILESGVQLTGRTI